LITDIAMHYDVVLTALYIMYMIQRGITD